MLSNTSPFQCVAPHSFLFLGTKSLVYSHHTNTNTTTAVAIMKTLLSLLSWVLLVMLFSKHVQAESEFAHAAERVLAYMMYRAEEIVDPRNNPKAYTIAPYCSDGLGRRCNFNEVGFLSKRRSHPW